MLDYVKNNEDTFFFMPEGKQVCLLVQDSTTNAAVAEQSQSQSSAAVAMPVNGAEEEKGGEGGEGSEANANEEAKRGG